MSIEGVSDGHDQIVLAINRDVFLASEWNGFEHGARKIYERLGGFRAHEPLSDGREDATKGRVEVGSAEELGTKRLGDELTKFLGSGNAAMLKGVREAVLGALGADGEVALSAVLEGKRTQTSAILGAIGRHRDLQSKEELGFNRELARRKKSARHSSNRLKFTA